MSSRLNRTYDTDVITLRRIIALASDNRAFPAGYVLTTGLNGLAQFIDPLNISSINEISSLVGILPNAISTLSTSIGSGGGQGGGGTYNISSVSTVYAYGNTTIFNVTNAFLSPDLLSTYTVSTGTVYTSTIQFIDGSQIASMNVNSGILYLNGSPIQGEVTKENLVSTVIGLGTVGYISSSALTDLVSTANLVNLVSTSYFTSQVTSTVIGLGTVGYISTPQLLSTSKGLADQITGTNTGVTSNQLISTVAGLGSIGYVSTSGIGPYISAFSATIATSFTTSNANIKSLNVSSITFGTGTGNLNLPDIYATSLSTNFITVYNSLVSPVVSTQELYVSSITGISIVTPTNLTSTVVGLGTIGYISSAALTNLVSTANLIGLVSTSYLTSQLTSTVVGLGTIGYVSSAALTNLVSTANLIDLVSTSYLTSQLTSTVVGLGTVGYVSSAALTNLVSTANLIGLVSTSYLTSQLTSTVVGLGTVGYVSTSQLLSTSKGLYDQIQNAPGGGVTTANLTSTVIGLGTVGYISSLSGYNISTGTVTTSSISFVDTATNVIQNVTVTNGNLQLNSSNVGGGGNQIFTDSWFQTNLINPPSSIYFGAPISKSSQIFIPWTYPTQINVGFQPSWLQTIVALNGFVSTNVSGINPLTLINQLSSGYVNLQNYHVSTSYITGVVLTKTTGTTGIQNIVFPQDGIPRNSLVYYNTALAGITRPGQFGAWYQNYNNGSNIASTIFSPYSAGGPPSIVQRLFSTGVTSNSLYFYFSTPTFVDISDPTSAATISSYTISYSNMPIPGVRYGNPVYNSSITNIYPTFNFVGAQDGLGGEVIRQYENANLYPDSTYTFSVAATNTIGFTGPYASTIGISTLNLLPIDNTISVNFASRYYTGIYRVKDNAATSNLANSSASAWTSDPFTLPIHEVDTRGSQATNLAFISTSFTSPTVTAGPKVNFNGFPATTPGAATANNQTITPAAVVDRFAASNAAYQGYYLNMPNTVTIQPGAFVANSTIYTLQITGAQSTLRGMSTSQTTLSYYFDGSPGSAAITDIITNYSSTTPPSYSPISGVNVVYGTPTFSTITGASNLGNYFYHSPLINYTLNIGGTINNSVSETTLTNIIPNITTGHLPQSARIVFSNGSIQSGSLATTFASNVSMSATATNTSGTSGSTAYTFSTIVDGPSYTLVNSTLPASLQTANTASATTGYRIWSYSNFDATNIYVVPFCYTPVATPLSYTNYSYNHAYSLVDNTTTYPTVKELQVVNGYHVSKGALGNAYMNYNGYYYTASLSNTVTYRSITNDTTLRFASFGWNIATQGTNYVKASFIVNYNNSASAGMAISNSILVFTSPGNFPTNPTDKPFLFYRVEDQAAPLPVTPYGTTASSVWLDANGTTGNVASGYNYSTDSTGNQTQILGGSAEISFNSSAITFSNCFIPAFNTTGKTIRIFCRFGVPMNFSFAFTTITLQLT